MSETLTLGLAPSGLLDYFLARSQGRMVDGMWRSGLTHWFLVSALLGSNPSIPATFFLSISMH